MKSKIDYSHDLPVRRFEKQMLIQAFAEACEPGNHCDSCTPYNPICPYRNG